MGLASQASSVVMLLETSVSLRVGVAPSDLLSVPLRAELVNTFGILAERVARRSV
jgi:hypothetical protein